MTTRLLVLVLAVATAPILSAQSAQDAVKTTHETLVAAVKSGNLTLVQSLIHPQAVGFYRASVRLVELSASYRAADAIPDVLADLGQFVIVPHETSYRVIGGTAVVSMATSMQANAEAKKDRVKDRSTRSTYVYVAVDGNWKLLSWHTSDTPLVK